MKIDENAYQDLINGDLKWLASQEHSCEKMHIEAILKSSPHDTYHTVDINDTRNFLLRHYGKEISDKFYYAAINGEIY